MAARRPNPGRRAGADPAPDIAAPAADTAVSAPTVADSGLADAVEVDRVVPASGIQRVAGQRFWLGPHRAGQSVTLWIDTTTARLAVAGQHLKTVPSRLSSVDLARLRADGARPAGPPAARPFRSIRCRPRLRWHRQSHCLRHHRPRSAGSS